MFAIITNNLEHLHSWVAVLYESLDGELKCSCVYPESGRLRWASVSPGATFCACPFLPGGNLWATPPPGPGLEISEAVSQCPLSEHFLRVTFGQFTNIFVTSFDSFSNLERPLSHPFFKKICIFY